jgi:putative NIF3 family GTP cyclohydrolase 1 type 2
MEAKRLYAQLEKDFIKPGMSDDWAQYMNEIKDFLSSNFKKRSIGLVCDFTKQINKVYSAVFPSDKVLQEILSRNETDIMLFVHHPSIWDIRRAPNVFQQMKPELLKKLKERRCSIYNLHVPLDNFSNYSTSKTLAEALKMKVIEPFAPYFGGLAGVIAETNCKTIRELKKIFEIAVGHEIKVYPYGPQKIDNGLIMICAGGGNDMDVVPQGFSKGAKIIVTGISSRNSHSEKVHEYEQENKITVLGGTHYSTEVFACKAMCDYFKKLGLDSEFIEDSPVLEDM